MCCHIIYFFQTSEQDKLIADSCNKFNFMLGALFYENNPATIFQLMTKNSFSKTNKHAYNMSYAAASLHLDQSRYLRDPLWRRSSYNFCTFDNIACKLLLFNSFDYVAHFVTQYYYNIYPGACVDTFTIPPQQWLVRPPRSSLLPRPCCSYVS